MRHTLQFASILTAISLAVATIAVMTTIGRSPDEYSTRGVAVQEPFNQAAATFDRG